MKPQESFKGMTVHVSKQMWDDMVLAENYNTPSTEPRKFMFDRRAFEKVFHVREETPAPAPNRAQRRAANRTGPLDAPIKRV